MKQTVQGLEIIISNGVMELQEIARYIDYVREQNPGKVIRWIQLTIAGPNNEDVIIEYQCAPPPFQRIRRITGYLVGTMDRFNDAKAAEVADRVKHGMEGINDGKTD